MGTFDAIQIGSSGMNAQRRGVELAGQNIANVNTDGYTRQRVEITPDPGSINPAIHSVWNGTGLGVRDVDYARLRDIFVDRRVREESALSAENDVLAETFTAIERILNDPTDSGLSGVLADFYAAWDDVANRPDDISARIQLVEQAETLTADLNSLRASLESLQDVHRSRISSNISQVNADAAQVAELQAAIASGQASGVNVNELIDQRDLLLQGISESIGGTARYEDDGTVSYFVNGATLIRGDDSYALDVVENGGVTEVVWPLDGRSAGVGGETAGLLEAVNTLIPEHIAEVDGLATTVMNEVNTVHATGFDLDGNPGQPFFQIGVNGVEVNPAVAADPRLVAASNTAGTLDGSVAGQIAELSGTADAYRELVVRTGVRSQAAQRRSDLQAVVVQQVEAEQQAASGVNLDEELSDLVRFQRAYEANARFVSAVDDLLNTLVNGTGRVGR